MIKKCLLLVCFCLAVSCFSQPVFASDVGQNLTIMETIVQDYKIFYTGERLTRMGIVLGAGAILANTDLDRDVQDWYQEDVRSSASDDFSEVAEIFGDGWFTVPVVLFASGINYFVSSDSPIGKWGMYSTRALCVGGPTSLLLQVGTGGSRPGEADHGSHWRPFDDNNGSSGHAFVGAIPFLTIAKMNNNKLIKYLAYGASMATAWSRINDDAHFLSQAIIGWYLALESVNTVFAVNEQQKRISITPAAIDSSSYGLAINFTW